MEDDIKLNFVLIGKPGGGKSATGNTLLNKQVFKASANSSSQTKDVDYSMAKFGIYTLMVVDGPGYLNSDTENADSQISSSKIIDQTLSMCNESFDAFLLVIEFGSRFTDVDMAELQGLKDVLGDTFLDHVIVVVSHGDLFQKSMDEDSPGLSFKEWCKQQKGQFGHLHEVCQGRFVLFNNIEKSEEKRQAQTEQVVQLALDIKTSHGRYGRMCFGTRNSENKILMELRLKIEEEISLLTREIDNLIHRVLDDDVVKMRARVQELKKEVSVNDNCSGVLQDLHDLLGQVEDEIYDLEMIARLSQELAEINRRKNIFYIPIKIFAILHVPLSYLLAHTHPAYISIEARQAEIQTKLIKLQAKLREKLKIRCVN